MDDWFHVQTVIESALWVGIWFIVVIALAKIGIELALLFTATWIVILWYWNERRNLNESTRFNV